jgi:hypothetical protein
LISEIGLSDFYRFEQGLSVPIGQRRDMGALSTPSPCRELFPLAGREFSELGVFQFLAG